MKLLKNIKENKMIYQNPICLECLYFSRGEFGFKCKAFESGIPEIILTGEIEHNKPLPEQKNDFVFKDINDATPAELISI
jgi:hypothetical protein